MKDGTRYAVQLRKVYARFRKTVSIPVIEETDDPIRRLALAVLGAESSEEKASVAVRRLLDRMADWNEVRVSRPVEIHRAVGTAIPDALRRAQMLVRALQSVYDSENRMSLDRIRSMGRRDARTYLEELNGLDEFGVASVMLWSLGAHAIPVDARLFEALQKAELVHPAASRAEVQAFLERNIGAADAREFCLVMRSFAASLAGGAKEGKAKAAPKSVGGASRKSSFAPKRKKKAAS